MMRLKKLLIKRKAIKDCLKESACIFLPLIVTKVIAVVAIVNLKKGLFDFEFFLIRNLFFSQDYKERILKEINMKKILNLLFISAVLVLFSCDNEAVLETQYNKDVMDEELLGLVKSVNDEDPLSIGCIRFNYNFALFIFDENAAFLEAVSMRSDLQFFQLLDGLPTAHSISLNYPISGTLTNGDLIEITTNEQLKEAISSCFKEERRTRCNNTLPECIWQVRSLDDELVDFENTFFRVDNDGTVTYFNGVEIYFGTWVTLYIGDDLYLNIDLNNGDEVEEFWDENWKITEFTFSSFTIRGNAISLQLAKDCALTCTTGFFRGCELEGTPDIALFNFSDYAPCIAIPDTPDELDPVSHSFYETLEEAETGENEISITEYTNISNPQEIFVRTIAIETQKLLEISQLDIQVLQCPEG
jgi:hypothetical protein